LPKNVHIRQNNIRRKKHSKTNRYQHQQLINLIITFAVYLVNYNIKIFLVKQIYFCTNEKNLRLTLLTDNILKLMGKYPLVQLNGERIFAKAEFFNSGGSINTPASSIK